MDNENNIFDFAGSELSQDAVICWCVNFFNHKENPLYGLGREVLSLFSDFEENDSLIIHRQIYKTDILLYLKNSRKAVIIEDKVYTCEHDEQIERYKTAVSKLSPEEKKDLNMAEFDGDNISTVYFKTGFFYDGDALVKADRFVTGEKFLSVIEKYKEYSEILKMYCHYLSRIIKQNDINGNFADTENESFWNWNISKNHIAQYKFMRTLFPTEMWNKKDDCFKVYNGLNLSGRPWTETIIYNGILKDGRKYCVFWRVDTDRHGPYISLRFYDYYNKKDGEESVIHIEKYNFHKEQIEEILIKTGVDFGRKKISAGNENFYEAALVQFPLYETIKKWETGKSGFTEKIRKITAEFIAANGKTE